MVSPNAVEFNGGTEGAIANNNNYAVTPNG